MSEVENGEALSMEQRLQEIQKRIDEYTDGLCLPHGGSYSMEEVNSLLNKTRDDIKKMTKEDCIANALFLLNFNFFLQRAINKELRLVSECEEAIKKIIARRVNQVRAASADERKQLAILDDDVASKLDKLKIQASFRVTETAFLVNRIQNIAEAYRDASKVWREN